MNTTDMIALLREHIADEQAVGWPNENELVAFLDQAANLVSEKLIAYKDYPLLKRVTASDTPQALPDGFVKFVGNVPVSIVGNEYHGYGEEIDVLCWCKYPLPSSFERSEDFPFDRRISLLIVEIARILAQNKNEFDISQDMSLLGAINTAISAARRGRGANVKAVEQA